MTHDYDYVIMGSGFGGSVSALRLTEKGYRILVVEKGGHWEPDRFPRTNWNLRKWMWLPLFRFHGFFKMTIMRHVGILSGVGVGGGSLVYAATLPRPKQAFFESGSWSDLADWKNELEPHYLTVEKMLGVAGNPGSYDTDEALRSVAGSFGRSEHFEPTRVGIFFGEPDKEVGDPYFGGIGPRRSGCTHCGGCMTGCRYGAKNSLEKNYLFLAEHGGAKVQAHSRLVKIVPLGKGTGSDGYRVTIRDTAQLINRTRKITCQGLILAGGVLGTVRLLLNMKDRHLERLSPRLGDQIRTNNESLVLVHSRQKEKDFSKGVAIGSIFPPDDNTHLEAVRYGSGSGFWKLMGVPLTYGRNMATRTGKLVWKMLTRPAAWLRVYASRDFARESMILLFMQDLDSTLRFRRGVINLRSAISSGSPPSAFMPLARELANTTAGEINGYPFVMLTEAIMGTPTTAHILGGCVIGKDRESGVVDLHQRVFGYQHLYVCDGSAVSANPGVNPSLTIAAMTERVMSHIPRKE